MGTRWRSRLIFGLASLLIAFGLAGISNLVKNHAKYDEVDFFHTEQYEESLHEFQYLLTRFDLIGYTQSEAINSIEITEDDVEQFKLEYRVTEEANSDIHQLIRSTKEREIMDYFNAFESEPTKQSYSNYQEIYYYYLTDTETGGFYTNLHVEDVEQFNQTIRESNFPVLHRESIAFNTSQFFPEALHHVASEYEGSFVLIDNEANPIIDAYYTYKKNKTLLNYYGISGVVALIIGLFIILKQLKRMFVIRENMPKLKQFYQTLPVDISILVLVLFLLLGFVWIGDSARLFNYQVGYRSMNDGYSDPSWSGYIVRLIGITMVVGASIVQIRLLYLRLKPKYTRVKEIKNSVAIQFLKACQALFIKKGKKPKLVIWLSVVLLFFPLAFLSFWKYNVEMEHRIIILLLTLPTFMILIIRAAYFQQISRTISEIAAGESSADLPVLGKSNLTALAQEVNDVKEGVKRSLEQQARSERLKTELITNVSHDLRTPLTSIISYTELLKNPRLTEEQREHYIEVIDRKSKRLNLLIEDLFEASKMASGNIELEKANVDIIQLLQQALGEYEEKIEASELDFRVKLPTNSVFTYADGQKLWRVFDNLIENIIKYALENTRVYIAVQTVEEQIAIEFKNITREELGENTEELLERFKRGDTARNTEGSGLGLAIAKSIIDLHDGTFDMEVDGDLFKITILLKRTE
ncbi:sensor histidine kinase [Ornithinibacillus xuwenensis]|uniref:histidine kinase n=1 Tax=Ornithinibacillus xuwenensis TaxID=3144668 RepID=A0ABU9XJV7_9BACI